MQGSIRLAEVLGALSYGLDMTEGQPQGHCVRSCWIGMHVGKQLGLDEAELSDLYYTVLLKDLGCSSNAARICSLYLTDDQSFKHDFKLVDGSLGQLLGFVMGHTGAKAGLADRVRALISVVRDGERNATEFIETRCQRGAEIARQMRFPEPVAGGILDLDEHWDGGGLPLGLEGETISLLARIALLSQVVDVFQRANGREPAIEEIRRRSGSWFDPRVAAAFLKVAARETFWAGLADPDIEALVLAMEPGQHAAMADEDYLDDIAAAFARVIDAKSPFTAGHSERVAFYADLIAEEMGMAPDRRRWLRRAALLHDIGKLGISNTVLDKPGKLDPEEWAAVRRHSEYSETILSRIAAFAELAEVAGAHHERLDGSGYPRGLLAERIALETRIIATADVFDALSADRPYRAAMPAEKAMGILWQDAGTAHDPHCIAALERGLKHARLVRHDGTVSPDLRLSPEQEDDMDVAWIEPPAEGRVA